MLSQRKVSQMDNKELLHEVIHSEDMIIIESNSRRGLTKRTLNNYTLCIEEICKRLDIEYVESEWNK